MSSKLTDRIAAGALPVLAAAGYDLADLELVKEGANWYLRFYIEGPEDITLNDCERASRLLSDWLDETDPLPQAYFLEVSSPGLERPLKKERDFIRFAGQPVTVRLFSPIDGRKTYTGRLGPADAKTLTLTGEGNQVLIFPREKIAGVNLYWDENEEG